MLVVLDKMPGKRPPKSGGHTPNEDLSSKKRGTHAFLPRVERGVFGVGGSTPTFDNLCARNWVVCFANFTLPRDGFGLNLKS